jgi:hypothetical protein
MFSPQIFARSCWLACISYILWKPEQDLLLENSDILSEGQLNFIWLYCVDLIEILSRYHLRYTYASYSHEYAHYLWEVGTIIYIDQIDHFLVRLPDWWADSHIMLRGIPQFGYRNELPYIPSYIIYLTI